jgi:hypothetical protein
MILSTGAYAELLSWSEFQATIFNGRQVIPTQLAPY